MCLFHWALSSVLSDSGCLGFAGYFSGFTFTQQFESVIFQAYREKKKKSLNTSDLYEL